MWQRIKVQLNLALFFAILSFVKALSVDIKEQQWQFIVIGFFWLVLSRLDLIYERLKKT